MNLKGLSIKDILTLDRTELLKLSRSDLAKLTSRLVSAANKRVRRLKANPLSKYSPALKRAMEGGRFSVSKKDVNRLRTEFGRVSRFLSSRTSTFKGFQKEKKRVQKLTGFKPQKGLSKRQQAMSEEEFNKQFWSTYRKAMELRPQLSMESGASKQLLSIIRGVDKDDLSDLTTDDIRDMADKALDDIQAEVDRPKEYFRHRTRRK